ncbi:ribonuclease P protein subunit p29 isoform X1 [Bacillus rossius redtenbacheri]|uniref:ribonuclease P protein subunit p29 isoform X1 n=1 Tax=Bacillus rossius redtenbacheri TaxID=93214 RepID=UPI002FDC8F7D
MDDGNGKLYSKLPRAVAGKAFNTLPSNPDASFDMFLKTSLSEKALFESENELKRSILLKKHKKKIQGKTRQRKTYLSRKERKELGLNKLDYKNLKFRDFHSLHQLWKKYMRNYLNLDNLKNLSFTGSGDDRQRSNVLLLLVKAEYVGAFVKVKRSKCCSLTGKKGIILCDTLNTFTVIDQKNVVRKIPKESCIFSVSLDKYEFTIYGKLFCIRSSHRSAKKIRLNLIPDL